MVRRSVASVWTSPFKSRSLHHLLARINQEHKRTFADNGCVGMFLLCLRVLGTPDLRSDQSIFLEKKELSPLDVLLWVYNSY